MIKVKVVYRGEVTVSIRVRVSYSSKVCVRFPISSASLSLRHRADTIVYGQATTSFIIVVSL